MAQPSASAILRVSDVTRRFGGLTAVDKVSLALVPGEIRALIGPNGAGKTSLFNLITGVLPCSSGSIEFKGARIDHLPPFRRFKQGMARSFQIVNLFADSSVEENVRIAAQAALKRTTHPFEWVAGAAVERRVAEVLDRFRWIRDPSVKAGSLNYAEQKKLETLMALTSDPELLLLDEPTAGIDENDIALIIGMIMSCAENRTILVTDHDVRFVMKIAHRITVLDQGSIIAEGTPEEVAADPVVDEVYFGGGG
ncbi:MAG: ABC transporter ATP-binding protein [Burkholderiales bacterium]|nr:ABC transporter ATP-binding protein [Burkholderiales bacterium]